MDHWAWGLGPGLGLRHEGASPRDPQLEGAFPDTMTKCAELLNRTVQVDFVDINVGCPIDLVFKKVAQGGGGGPAPGGPWW